MSRFQDVTLHWQGDSYKVPRDRLMGLIADVEWALSGGRANVNPLAVLYNESGPHPSRLAAAMGAALRYAGAEVTDLEIYEVIIGGVVEGDETGRAQAYEGVAMIAALLVPPPEVADRLEGSGGKKPQAASSRASTKRRSKRSG